MIDPAGIPLIPGDMDALAGHARTLSVTGGQFSGTGQRINATWQGLSSVYRAPEAGQLLVATAPVQAITASIATDLGTAGSALASYASEVKGIQARLEALRAQATAFAHSVRGHHDWQSDSGKVGQNNQLIAAVNTEVAAFFDAQRRCANAINALYGGQQYHADDGHKTPGDYGYTAGQLGAAAHNGQPLPWGREAQHDRGFWGDVGAFFAGAGTGVTDFVAGLGGLVGYGNGQWSLSNAGTAWKGLGTFAVALGTYTAPSGIALDQTVGVPGFRRGQLGDTLENAGKSLVAWNEWSKDPSRAAGTATFNIVTAAFGTKGAGAALHGVGAAAESSDLATLARAGTVMTRGSDVLTKIPTVSDVTGDVLKRMPTLRLPDLHDPNLSIPTEHVDIPRATDIPATEPNTIGDNLAHTPELPETHLPDAPAHDSPPENLTQHQVQGTPVRESTYSLPEEGNKGWVESLPEHWRPDTSAHDGIPDSLPEHGLRDIPVHNGFPETSILGVHGGHVPPPSPNEPLASSQHPDQAGGHGGAPPHVDVPAHDSGTAPSHGPEQTPHGAWSELGQPTRHIHEPAVHHDSAPTGTAKKRFLARHFPDLHLDRLNRPLYGDGARFQQNCTHCVVTVESRLNGTEVLARPHQLLGDPMHDLMKALPPGNYHGMTSYDDIIRFMHATGPDSRGVVYIARQDGTAHVFNVVNSPAGVVFLDGQIGDLAHLEPGVTMIGLYHYR